MKRCAFALACLLALVWCHTGRADIMVSFDMNPAEDGIQEHHTVNLGEEFDVDVWFMPTGGDNLATYSFATRFNTDLLELKTDSHTPPPDWAKLGDRDDPKGFDDPRLGAGRYGQLELSGINLDDEVPPLTSSHQVASLRFQADSLAQDLVVIYATDEVDSFEGGFFDNDNEQLTDPLFHTGSITVVPEPGSWIMMVTAMLVGLAIMVRRKTGDGRLRI